MPTIRHASELLIPCAISRTKRCCFSACTPPVGVRRLTRRLPITTSKSCWCCDAHWNPPRQRGSFVADLCDSVPGRQRPPRPQNPTRGRAAHLRGVGLPAEGADSASTLDSRGPLCRHFHVARLISGQARRIRALRERLDGPSLLVRCHGSGRTRCVAALPRRSIGAPSFRRSRSSVGGGGPG